MVRWHHRLNGHEFGYTPGIDDGQGGLASCGPWDCKESDMTEWLNWTEHIANASWHIVFSIWFTAPSPCPGNWRTASYIEILWYKTEINAKMQNPRDQEYSENEMLAFLKICRTSRQSFDLILSEFRCFDIPPDLGGTAPPRVGQFLQSKQFTHRLPFKCKS